MSTRKGHSPPDLSLRIKRPLYSTLTQLSLPPSGPIASTTFYPAVMWSRCRQRRTPPHSQFNGQERMPAPACKISQYIRLITVGRSLLYLLRQRQLRLRSPECQVTHMAFTVS